MFRKFFLIFLLFLPGLRLAAQNAGRTQSREEQVYWETVLDAYEDFAKTHEEMHGKRRAAEVLKKKQQHIEQLLLHPKGKMTQEQQQRFNSISLKAGLPIVLPSEPTAQEGIPAADKNGDNTAAAPIKQPVRQVEKAATPQPVVEEEIPFRERPVMGLEAYRPEPSVRVWNTVPSYSPDIPEIVPVPKPPIPWDTYLLLQAGFAPEWQVGLMAGARHPAGVGVYASWRIHPVFTDLKDAYVVQDASKFWASGKSATPQQYFNLGILAGKGRFNGFLGAGYAYRNSYWQDVDGKWARIPSASLSGFSLEAGGLYSSGRLSISLGVNTLRFKTLGVSLGIGLAFSR